MFDGPEGTPVAAARKEPLVLGGEVDVAGRVAAIAASVRAVSSHLEPWRVLPERRLPAERSLPGHWPAQEARCRSEGKRLMSVPISASTGLAVRRCMPGIVQSSSTACREGELRLDLVGEQLDLLVEEVEMGEDRRHDQRALAAEAADQRLLERRTAPTATGVSTATWSRRASLALAAGTARVARAEPRRRSSGRLPRHDAAGPDAQPAPDLICRDFSSRVPGRRLCGDITYIRTWAAGPTSRS